MKKIIFLLFFFSGFSALIYEVVWVRVLALTLGNTVYASSTVLAVFMGGLAAGAWFGGRIADKYSSAHLRMYGYIELLVGIVAPLITLCLAFTPTVYASLINPEQSSEFMLIALRLLLSAALLLIPCLLMGATLPVLVRYVQEFEKAQEFFSKLYGFNTIGAALGAVSASFLGFTYLGLNETVLTAALVNLIIGLVCIRLDRSKLVCESVSTENLQTEDSPALSANKDGAPAINSAPIPAQQKLLWMAILSGMSGFTALAYEVVWTRMLNFHLMSITYTFSTMVATFLLGLALGSFIFQKFLFKKERSLSNNLMLFALVQYISAFVSAAAFLCAPFITSTRSFWLNGEINGFLNMGGQLAFTAVVSFACLLPPATVIGALFPCLGTLAAGNREKPASSVGSIYAANTIGCVLGSICAGLVLLPVLGWFKAFQFLLIISTAIGFFAAILSGKWKRPLICGALILPLIGSFLFMKYVQGKPYINPRCKLLFQGEDALGTILIVDDPKLKGKTLIVNGSCLATTLMNSSRYMRLLAHLPLLMHPSPKSALIGCFGTGSTSGAVALHPQLKKVDIVELSPLILHQNKLFAAENYNVLSKPNVHVYINDVRNFLLCSKSKYDVVTFEPPPPADAGIVNLYTSEFYKIVKSHLNKDGIMCQWAPMDCGSGALWKMLVITARTVFPHVSVWLPNSHEAIIMASDQPLVMDFARMQERINASPEIAKNLKEVGLDDAMAISATYILSGKELDAFLGDLPAITDNHPHLEFFLPYTGPALSDLELDEAGRAQAAQLFGEAKLKSARGFDFPLFQRYFAAMHLMHMTQNSPAEDAKKYLEQASKLVPNNAFLEWLKENYRLASKGSI